MIISEIYIQLEPGFGAVEGIFEVFGGFFAIFGVGKAVDFELGLGPRWADDDFNTIF